MCFFRCFRRLLALLQDLFAVSSTGGNPEWSNVAASAEQKAIVDECIDHGVELLLPMVKNDSTDGPLLSVEFREVFTNYGGNVAQAVLVLLVIVIYTYLTPIYGANEKGKGKQPEKKKENDEPGRGRSESRGEWRNLITLTPRNILGRSRKPSKNRNEATQDRDESKHRKQTTHSRPPSKNRKDKKTKEKRASSAPPPPS